MRLLGLLLALAARGFAAEPVKVVQLSLDFAAKPAIAPIVAPSARFLQFPDMPAPVATALNAGDAHAFYRAAVAHDWQIPRGDDRQEALFAEGADRARAEAAFAKLSEPEVILGKKKPAPKSTKLDYDEFGRQISGSRLSTNVFRDTDAKRRILLASGYTHLKGPNGTRIPLAKADDVRIGKAFENVLAAYSRRDN